MGEETESREVNIILESEDDGVIRPLDATMVDAVGYFMSIACEQGRVAMILIPTDDGIQAASNVHESEWVGTLENLVNSLKIKYSATFVPGNESEN